MSLQQRKLYFTDGGDNDVDPAAQGVIAIQQHTVFVEIIASSFESLFTFQQYAAVVGLVKKCKQSRNVFDNAVLWFNDQFLFGNKSNRTSNVTPPHVMGRNPNRTISMSDLLDPNRINGTHHYNYSASDNRSEFVRFENGTGPNEGGNPDRDGFIRALDFQERWGGCFIPDGFVHAIGADDPYGIGRVAHGDAHVAGQLNASANASFGHADQHVDVGDDGTEEVSPMAPICDNICFVKQLIDLEAGTPTSPGCPCGIFTHVGSFFITDPNNHRWIVDEFIYPVDLATQLVDDPTNCHEAVLDPEPNDGSLSVGGLGLPDDEDERPEPIINPRCTKELERPDSYGSSAEFRETDRKGNEGLKFTTKEVLLTVHIQVDPWNPDRQGFPDEAIWAYTDGQLRLGMPYTEDQTTPSGAFCHDEAIVDPGKPEAYEYDRYEGEAERKRIDEGYPDTAQAREYKWNLSTAPGNGSSAWHEFRRGPVGNTVECAIEYNFLIAVFFEAFDNTKEVDSGHVIAMGATGVYGNATTQDEGTGENEIVRNFKHHGPTAPDAGDQAWKGNSHPHNPRYDRVHPDPLDPAKCIEGANGVSDWLECDNDHRHDGLVLDIFYHPRAPAFTMDNPYWDHYNGTETTAGTPPLFKAWPRDALNSTGEEELTPVTECLPGDTVQDTVRRNAIFARRTILCDVDAVDGFHLHDGLHEI